MDADELEGEYDVSGLDGDITGSHNEPRNKYRHNLRDLLRSEEIAEADKHAAVEFFKAIDPDTYSHSFTNADGQQETKSVGTLHSYAHNLKRVAVIMETPLTEIESADEINRFFDDVATGDHSHPSVKSDGYSEGTLKGWQSAVSKFYQYHEGHEVEPHEIVIAKQKRTHVDERDMFTVEEVNALREACDNPRDRCLLELLLNTGQRIRAIQTLRIKDVDPQEGAYWLNTDAEGLKGADKNGGKRPLLGAKQPVFDWLEYHPTPNDPEAALITKRPGHSRGTAGKAIAQSSMRKALRKIAEEAGVDKPPNPHNFRHYFVTVAKREYNMDDATIKYLIGHSPDSTVMETTYQHLTDEDYLKAAEVDFGVREPENESPLTPEICGTCGNQLEPDAKACARCGTVYTPDGEATKDDLRDRVREQKEEADSLEEYKDADAIAQALEDDPKLAADLMQKLGDIAGDE